MPSDVDLFGVVAGLDEDGVGDCVVGDAEDGGLDGAVLLARADKDRVIRATLERILSGLLAGFTIVTSRS